MTKARDLAGLGAGFTQTGTGAVQRTVENKLNDVVSVKDFGAVGDGTTDDTAALQAAINSGAKIITSPIPLYLNTDGVTINLISNQRFEGVKFVSVHNAGTYCLTGASVSNVEFVGCEFELRNSQRGISFTGTGSGIVVENTRFIRTTGSTYSAYGIRFEGTYTDITITSSWFENVCGSASIKFGNVNKVVINNNHFKSTITDPGVSYRPDYPCQLDFELGSDAVVGNNVFDIPLSQDRGTTADATGYALYQGDGQFDRLTVSGNTILGTGIIGEGIGIKVGGGTYSSDYVISNNQISGPLLSIGISLLNITKTIVSGNFVDDAGLYACSIERSYSISVQGNNLRCASGGTPHVLFIGDGSDYSVPSGLNVVSGNYLKKESTGSNRGCITFRTYHSTTVVQNNILDSSDGLAYIRELDAGVDLNQTNASTYSVVIVNDADNTKLNAGVLSDPLPTYKIGRRTTYTTGADSLFAVTSAGKSVMELNNSQGSTNTIYSGINFTNSNSGISGRRPCFIDALTSDSIARGRQRIGVTNASNAEIYVEVNSNNRFIPSGDGSLLLGSGSTRWNTIFSTSGTINTSDEREKQDIEALSDAELRVATALKGLVKKFRFKDAVQAKADDARIHVGVIAQEVIAAFQTEGLDPMRYGIVCYDQWEAELDDEGNEIAPAGDRYGIRYEELLAFIIAAL